MASQQHTGLDQTAQIMLKPDVLEVFCRRGRRRLKDIQSCCQAALRLDHSRGILHVRGTAASINAVMRQLEMLTGPCIPATSALWAELMRTRTSSSIGEAAVARIQHLTGCRIHIERTVRQVQLLGPDNATAVAQQLVQKLETMCKEEVMLVDNTSTLDTQVMQAFADEFGITLQVEEGQIRIMGIAAAAAEACTQFAESLRVGSLEIAGNGSEICRIAVRAAIAELKVDGVYIDDQYCVPDPIEEGTSQLMGAVIAKLPPSMEEAAAQPQPAPQQAARNSRSYGACATCGCSANFCVKCGHSTRETLQCTGAGCPVCGIVNFCMFCGHPTEKNLTPPKPSHQPKEVRQSFPQPQEFPQTDKANQSMPPSMSPNMMPMVPVQTQDGMMMMYVPVNMMPMPYQGYQPQEMRTEH